jgi:hypothetical protein
MTRGRDVRAARRNPPKRAHLDVPVEPEHDDEDHDGYSPVRERENPILPLRDGGHINLAEPWPLPR